jgi:hypothetical protein
LDDLQEDPCHGLLARSRERQKSKPHLDLDPIGQKGLSIFGDGYLEFHLERACFETGLGLSGIPAMYCQSPFGLFTIPSASFRIFSSI